MIKFEINQYLVMAVFITFAIVLGMFLQMFTNIEVEKEKENIVIQKRAKLVVLGNFLEHEFNSNLNRITDIASNPVFKKFSYTDTLNSQTLGITQELETEKRRMLQNVLFSDALSSIGLFLPNGDIYLAEPYSSQLNLQDRNFSFRDWYKGVINSRSPYISESYQTQYTDEPTVAIAAPIIDDDNLVGIVHSTFEFPFLINSLNEVTLGENAKIFIVDHFGKVALASTKETSFDETGVSFNSLNQSFDEEDSLNTQIDEEDSLNTQINGEDFLILKSIISAGPHNWSVFLLQPYDNAFVTITGMQNLSLSILIVIFSLLGTTGTIIFYFIRKNLQIQQNLNNANKKLSASLKQLKGIEVLKEEFSAMITHELKTPLMPMLGYCKMLKKPDMIGNLNEEQLEAVDVIEKNSKRLQNLIGDILDARKLYLKKLKFSPAIFSLKELINELETSYEQTLKQNGITLSIKHNIDGQTMSSDKNRILQVFDNLISNSTKAVSPNAGEIELGINQTDSQINFYVKDNGIGIPKEKQKNLFKKFYQLDSSLKRKSEGSGLGLNICKGIVQGLGGKIWFESTEGKGTTFHFSIPIRRPTS